MPDIEIYSGKYDEQIQSLILDIQNNEAKINLSIEEQPDLKNIKEYYQNGGGNFWLAVDNGKVVGTVGLIKRENNCAVLKKFFVNIGYRGQKVGFKLYNELIDFAKNNGVKKIILDTPSVAKQSHRFYERAGFRKIRTEDLPIDYVYPDRDSLLYILDL